MFIYVKSSGCECTYALYTSKYSAAISQNLGNVEVKNVLNESSMMSVKISKLVL